MTYKDTAPGKGKIKAAGVMISAMATIALASAIIMIFLWWFEFLWGTMPLLIPPVFPIIVGTMAITNCDIARKAHTLFVFSIINLVVLPVVMLITVVNFLLISVAVNVALDSDPASIWIIALVFLPIIFLLFLGASIAANVLLLVGSRMNKKAMNKCTNDGGQYASIPHKRIL